jgi:hypothetical protein
MRTCITDDFKDEQKAEKVGVHQIRIGKSFVYARQTASHTRKIPAPRRTTLRPEGIVPIVEKSKRVNKEYKKLQPIMEGLGRYEKALSNLNSAARMLAAESDPEMREMAREEIAELEPLVRMPGRRAQNPAGAQRPGRRKRRDF